MLLVGDLGGTNLRLALWRDGELIGVRRWAVDRLLGLSQATGLFLQDLDARPEHACFGVAGPLDGNRCEHTNAGWVVDGPRIAADNGLVSALLINDFHAAAKGTTLLREEDAVSLGGRIDPKGTRVVLGPGTGLGVAIVHRGDVISGEGGHQDFAPRGRLQREALEWLQERMGRVSFEQVCSGPGLMNLHRFLSHRSPEALPAASPAAISGLADRCPVARQAVELFVDIYGQFAGDLALLTAATGGVWLAGGIAPQLMPVLQRRFRPAFEDKAPREHLLRPIGIRLITHPQPGLLGAGAVLAEKLANRD